MNRARSWSRYLLRLRFKKSWAYELWCSTATFLICLAAILPFAAAPHTIFQPKLDDQRLYEEAKRLSFLEIDTADSLPKSARVSAGHTEYSLDYFFTRRSDDGIIKHFQIDSAALLPDHLSAGRHPRSEDEVVIGASSIDGFSPSSISRLENNFGLPQSYKIVGAVKTSTEAQDVLFLSESLFSVTSNYRDLKLNLRAETHITDNTEYQLVFDEKLDSKTAELAGAGEDGECFFTFLDQRRALNIHYIPAADGKLVLRINPSTFTDGSTRRFKSVIFSTYQSKKCFLAEHGDELLFKSDSFSPAGGPKMEIKVALDYHTLALVPLVLIPFFFAMTLIGAERRSFDRGAAALKAPPRQIRSSDFVSAVSGQLLSLVLTLVLLGCYPLFYSPSTTLGVLGTGWLLIVMLTFTLASATTIIARWRSHEI